MMELVSLVYVYLQKSPNLVFPSGDVQPPPGPNEKDPKILKLMIASALVLKGREQSKLRQLLFDSVDSCSRKSGRELDVDLKLTMTVYSLFSPLPR